MNLDLAAVADAVRTTRDSSAFQSQERYHLARNSLELLNATIEATNEGMHFGFHDFHFGSDYMDLPEAFNPFLPCWMDWLKDEGASQTPPDIVGISMNYRGQLAAGLALARLVRVGLPRSRVVLGGSVVTRAATFSPPAVVDRFLAEADYLVTNEGETAFVEICRRESGGANALPANTILRTAEGKIFRGRPVVEDLGLLPSPDWSDIPWNDYLAPSGVVAYDAVRGCYWSRCVFCSYGLSPRSMACIKYRERDPRRVAQHFQHLVESTGTRQVIFADDAMRPAFLGRVCQELIERKVDVTAAVEMRADVKGGCPEYWERLRAAGIQQVFFGVESGSQRVLDIMKKGIDVGQLPQMYREAHAAGLAVGVQTFSGFPGETLAEAMATLQHLGENAAVLDLAANWDFCLLVGSELHRNPGAFDVTLRTPGADNLYRDEASYLVNGTQAHEWPRSFLDARRSVLVGDKDPWIGSAMSAHTLIGLPPDARDRVRRWKESQWEDPRLHGLIGDERQAPEGLPGGSEVFPRFPCPW